MTDVDSKKTSPKLRILDEREKTKLKILPPNLVSHFSCAIHTNPNGLLQPTFPQKKID